MVQVKLTDGDVFTAGVNDTVHGVLIDGLVVLVVAEADRVGLLAVDTLLDGLGETVERALREVVGLVERLVGDNLEGQGSDGNGDGLHVDGWLG